MLARPRSSSSMEVGILLPEVGILLPEVGILLPEVGILLPEVGILLPEVGILLPEVGILLLEVDGCCTSAAADGGAGGCIEYGAAGGAHVATFGATGSRTANQSNRQTPMEPAVPKQQESPMPEMTLAWWM